MQKCNCYMQHGMKYLCYGTKEMEECSCGGDESKCNFYPEKGAKEENRMRPIDAMETVIRISKRVTPLIRQGCHPQRVYSEILQVIAQAPTLDCSREVLCKDCHFHTPCDVRGKVWCKKMCRYMNPDDYCSRGERRNDG